MAEKEYRRLTWSRRRSQAGLVVFSPARSSLWLGKDHLLGIDTTGYTETYKRFYFRDIQAIIIRRTNRLRNWSLGLGVPAGLFALFAAVASREVVVASILGTVAGLFLLAALLNVAAGPTCVCHLRTAVQTEELPSLNRLRRTRKVLNRLRPFIVEAQGQLAPEDIPIRMQEWRSATANSGDQPAVAPRYVVDDPNLPPRIVP